MKNRKIKRFSIFAAAILTFTFVLQGITGIISDVVHQVSYAIDGNQVFFATTETEATNTNFIYVDLKAEGGANQEVTVSYQTFSVTAIRDIDFINAEKTVSLKLDASGKAEYRISIKCLNDTNTREKLRLYSAADTYGRYFNLKITGASNATPVSSKRVCKCYLPYENKVEATVGIHDSFTGREVAYITDYKTMLAQYDGGTGGLDGGSTRRTWEKGINFDNETTRRWQSVYINSGMADAYASFVIKKIDDGTWSRDGSVSVLAGNRQFIDNYKREKNRPGMYFYAKIDPPGKRLDGKAMEKIAYRENPYDKNDDLVDAKNIYTVGANHKHICWIQEKDAWFASRNSIYDSEFYKIDPYNGVLDNGLAAYNHNTEADMEVKDIWLFMTLYDSSAPVITGRYCDFDSETGGIKIYVRFNEPVYACKGNTSYMTVKINGKSTEFIANYVAGNYSDTLVYEIPENEAPTSEKITSLNYSFNNNDIGDMAYILQSSKSVTNNLLQFPAQPKETDLLNGAIDLTTPVLSVDDSNYDGTPRNSFNLIFSANDNGNKSFDSGTVYYTWNSEDSIAQPAQPSSYQYSHVVTPEEQGSFPITLAKNEQYSSGKYSLHAFAVSKFGKKKYDTFGPYLLDGDNPVIKGLNLSENKLMTKEMNLEVAKKAVSSTKIKTITLNASYKNSLGITTNKTRTLLENCLVPSDLTKVFVSADGENSTVYTYKSNINEALVETYGLDTFVQELMNGEKRIELSYSFTVEDEASNKATSQTIRTVYDLRTLFTLVPEFDVAYFKYDAIPTIKLDYDVYNIHDVTSDDGITFEITNETNREYIDQGAKFTLTINGDKVVTAEQYSIVLKDLAPGYYEIVGRISGRANEVDVDLISSTIKFNLTDEMTDDTENTKRVEGNLVLINRVYQLEEARFYYYNSTSQTVNNLLYGSIYNESIDRYEGGSTSPAFSSSVEAKKYIKYMEYQDMHLISINDAMANLLNSGSGSTVYVKAAGETRSAQAGQLWIRYKKNTWTPNIGTSGWAFYYYGDGNAEDGINKDALSANLNAAIDAVVVRIINSGAEKYLVAEGDLDLVTGAPYLKEGQMHVKKESVTETKMGTPLYGGLTYDGDSKLYDNLVKVNDKYYPIATNMALSFDDYTYLYYKDVASDLWIQLNAKDGTLMSDALRGVASGVYTMRDYGRDGVSQFDFYLDREAPQLSVTVDNSATPLTLDGTIDRISCTNLVINEMLNEIDPYAYVAIYNYSNRALRYVFYRDGLEDFDLSGGNYYLQVGDRSGNIYTYIVLTNQTKFDLTLEENEAKTGVYVKVSNRDESEIYSYNVYLNDNLIDTEFATSKFYRDSGVYRVEVTDIYGNTETKMLTHESPTPEITWYYLNENDGYSLYDPEKESRMYLEADYSSPRTTNVYSSTLVRMLFKEYYESSNIQFEVLDIDPTEYSFNASTGILSVNTLSSWRLRVWYENEPDNDHIYVFHLDNNAPEINSTFIGEVFHNYVERENPLPGEEKGKVIVTSTFDAIDYTKYNAGDVIVLDTLAYVVAGTETINFENGDVISGSHIVLQVSDPTGIRSFTVTRNGQPLEMELNTDNKLLISSYGYYVLTFTDNLGNVARFSFTNLEGPISYGSIDGSNIEGDVTYYGNDNLTIKTLYAGKNTILIRYGNNKSVTYVFNSDGSMVTYGQYYVREGGTDQEGSEIVGKYSELVNGKFSLLIDENEIKFNHWYPAVTTDDYVIYVLVDDNKNVNYKVECVKDPIEVETFYFIGNVHLPDRYIASLSKEMPVVTLLTGDKVITPKEDLEYIYIADVLTIDTNNINPNIKTIEYAYAENPEFGEYKTIYKNNGFTEEFVGEKDGFYSIIVTNIYNNKTVYLVSKIVAFVSVVNIHTLDESTVTFYNNDGQPIYANSSVELLVYSDSVSFLINDIATPGYFDKGITSIELFEPGTYHVTVVGDNGITENYTFVIATDSSFLFDEAWIIGYNEDALLRDQSYTNTLCSIELGQDVVFVDMVVNDEQHIVLYDNITEAKTGDETLLKDAIGSYGVGKYVVGFRNKYGDLVTKTVYFNDVPALILDRIITSDTSTYEVYDLAFAMTHDFYSNYVLRFSTTSAKYIFTINGVAYSLDEPKTIEFSNVSGNGSFSYTITYLDEYGNFVQFDAILLRQDLTIDVSEMNTITFNNLLYTRDDICVNFAEGLKATVSINGSELIDYNSGAMFYADGEYAFVVRDIAGNRYFYTVNHKSMNHYSLINSSTNEDIVFGGVINNSTVTFYPEDGSSHIKTVFRDGVLIENYTSSIFSQTGRYEVIIEDGIGNQSFEEFYVLNNSLCKFEYTAPFDYEVTEVWRIKADGTREMLNTRGQSITLKDNGDYIVVVTSTKTISSFNFSVAIDDTPPTAKLNGVENDSVTAKDVTLSGLKVGDVVQIYKDGKLISTTTINFSTDSPVINQGGKYRVVVTNVQGVTIEYNFVRKSIANVAGSVFVIVTAGILIAGISFGLIYHTKLKTDD